ncbi:unnamed protein product [Schistocephalus solidus]|uniref:ORF3 n=1 Tax=Schistocephalus solidus TaxID=70667 RepID=A0A183TIN9_SCHSO|nr:unnamed protein product [Schistocephalus solidus]
METNHYPTLIILFNPERLEQIPSSPQNPTTLDTTSVTGWLSCLFFLLTLSLPTTRDMGYVSSQPPPSSTTSYLVSEIGQSLITSPSTHIQTWKLDYNSAGCVTVVKPKTPLRTPANPPQGTKAISYPRPHPRDPRIPDHLPRERRSQCGSQNKTQGAHTARRTDPTHGIVGTTLHAMTFAYQSTSATPYRHQTKPHPKPSLQNSDRSYDPHTTLRA